MIVTDVLLAVTTLSFDIAGLEIWLPLSIGARVVIASRADGLDGERLISLIEAHGVTILQATPATWQLMLEAGWIGKRDLKALCGGEAMRRELAVALIGKVAQLWNMYGPTETTIWSTVSHILEPSNSIPIGHPIANTQIYVLDATKRLGARGDDRRTLHWRRRCRPGLLEAPRVDGRKVCGDHAVRWPCRARLSNRRYRSLPVGWSARILRPP